MLLALVRRIPQTKNLFAGEIYVLETDGTVSANIELWDQLVKNLKNFQLSSRRETEILGRAKDPKTRFAGFFSDQSRRISHAVRDWELKV